MDEVIVLLSDIWTFISTLITGAVSGLQYVLSSLTTTTALMGYLPLILSASIAVFVVAAIVHLVL